MLDQCLIEKLYLLYTWNISTDIGHCFSYISVKVHTLTSKGMNVMGNLKQYMINTQHKSCPLFSKTTIRYNLDTIFAEVEVKCGQPIISNLLD